MHKRFRRRGHGRRPTTLRGIHPGPALLALLTSFAGAASSADAQRQESDLERSARLAVMIESEFDDATGVYFGAGLIVGRRNDSVYVVTANHLLRRGELIANSVRVTFRMDPSRSFPATVLPLTEPGLDVGVLSIDGFDGLNVPFCSLPLRRLAASAPSASGVYVFALGYPNRQAWGMPAIPDPVTRMAGSRISFESRYVSVGHSGGPLLNVQGDVIGMIIGHSPPEGEALDIGPILDRLERWNVPVFLERRTSLEPGRLHLAVRNGGVEEVRALLARCADVSAVDSAGRTPLLDAVRTRNGEAVVALLEHGAAIGADSVVNVPNASGVTPLHSAATGGDEALVRKLVEHGATVDVRFPTLPESARFDNGWTPLHVAAQQGNFATVRALIAAGANVRLESARGESAVDRAIRGIGSDSTRALDSDDEARAQILKALYAAGGTGGIDLLATAIDRGAAAVVETILDHPDQAGSLSRDEATSLAAGAIRTGHASVVAVLLSSGVVDPNAEVGSNVAPANQSCLTGVSDLLTLAACHDRVDVARVLIEAGAAAGGRSERDPTSENTPLHAAGRRAGVAMARLLVEHGADPNVTPSVLASAVHRDTRDEDDDIIRVGDPDLVRTLLKLGADVDGPPPTRRDARRGPSPLQRSILELVSQLAHVATWETPPERPIASIMSVIELLLDNGADPDYFNRDDPGSYLTANSVQIPVEPSLHALVSEYLSSVSRLAPLTFDTLKRAITRLLQSGADPNVIGRPYSAADKSPVARLTEVLEDLSQDDADRAAALRDLIDLFRAHGGR